MNECRAYSVAEYTATRFFHQMHIRETFARNLRTARHGKGCSQERLALDAGVDRTYISALERCLYSASIDMVDRLAKVLEMEAAALLQRQKGHVRKKLPQAHP